MSKGSAFRYGMPKRMRTCYKPGRLAPSAPPRSREQTQEPASIQQQLDNIVQLRVHRDRVAAVPFVVERVDAMVLHSGQRFP